MAMDGFANKLKKLFGLHKEQSESFFEDLEDMLIEGDLGPRSAMELVDTLRSECKKNGVHDHRAMTLLVKQKMSGFIKTIELNPDPGATSIYLVLGVNGVGKTTSVAKLASWYEKKGTSVVMAAADTFRAAAIEQLQIHGQRLGIRVVAHQHGADPGAVIFDAAEAVSAKGGGLVLADTAGRLHNKDNLVRELQKIDRIAASKASPGCYKKILTLDSTSGQNALRQAEVFHQAVGIDALILTKYDSTAKGGVIASIGRELGLPVAFIGLGEGYADLQPFSADTYLDQFLGLAT